MAYDYLERSEMILGQNSIAKLKNSHVLIVGLGGVGSYCAEGLTRAGIGHLTICDHDTVSASNINRQLCALHSTIGQKKCKTTALRLLDINPDLGLTVIEEFYSKDSTNPAFCTKFDYIVDAIDTVSSKILLIKLATQNSIPIISCMGTGNKLCTSKLQITDIYKTSVCPLARTMRHELRKESISKLHVLFSTEPPIKPDCLTDPDTYKRHVPGSVSWVPSCAGLMLCEFVTKRLLNIDE